MKKLVVLTLVLVLIIIGAFVPIKAVKTGGSCPNTNYIQRHNLILGDTLPQAGNTSIGEGCAPLIKHELYLL